MPAPTPAAGPARGPAPRLLVAALALLTAGCGAGTRSSALDDSRRMRVEAYDPEAKLDRSGTGAHLAAIDRSIQQWNGLFLTGNRQRDARKLRGLEEDIRYRTLQRFDEMVSQLETGPPVNRRVAAAALGFTGHERARTPLLNALSDPEEDVVANALLGLAVLGDPLTPLSAVLHHLRFGERAEIRSNAALATLEVLRAGGEGGEEVREAARQGLHDPDVFVRTQCALILAHERDTDAVPDLALQLVDDTANSAAMAAGRALAYIGVKEITWQGRCARALTASLGKVNDQVRTSVLRDLQRLSGRNYSKDEDWVAWAHRLP